MAFPNGEGVKMATSIWRDFWESKREQQELQLSIGKVTIEKMDAHLGRKIHVSCPLNDQFTAGAKRLGGVWKARSSVWSFDPLLSQQVTDLCNRVFGPEHVIRKGFRSSYGANMGGEEEA